MKKRFLRSKGMASMKYGRESEYFTIVMHHGGFMVNSSGFKYIGKEPLRTDCDIISMLEDMPRNRHIHLYLEENEANFSNETIETRYQNATETHETVITEMHETHETYETFMTELNSEEDTEYVADDIDSSVSDFEYSENDMSEEEGSVHEVHVGVDFERDFNGLNNRDEGNINSSLNDENETDGVDSLHTENESDSESDSYGRGKHRCPEFNDETDMENPQFKVGMIFGDKLKFKEAVRQYGIKNRVDVRFKRIGSVRVHVVCKEWCPWANPQYPITALRQDVLEDYVYIVSLSKCLRAKNLALDMVLGSHKGQYSKIYDYLGELRSFNPRSITILKLDNRVFERMYICLQACKEGFKGCRPIISIDGRHLKGGTLLATVGIDGNDNIYPIAYVVGLFEEMMHVLPNAKHRTCVRHLYSNFKNNAQFKGKNLKDALWKAAKATYKKEFKDAMDELKALSKPAFDWLHAKDPAQCSKSHFSPRSKSDMLLSNLSECFNKMILEARDKPILTLMEMIRTKIMENIAKKNEVANKYTGSLCPRIQKKIELAIQQSTSKKGMMMYYSKCGQPGHNQRSFKGIVGGNMPPNSNSTRETNETMVESKHIRRKLHEKNYNNDYTIIKGCNITSTIITSCNIKAPSSSQVEPSFVFIPTPGHTFYTTNHQTENVMTVRWMPPSQEDVIANQQLSQLSTITQTSQEDCRTVFAKRLRML
ncbi:hypothetical protein F3Y22_tig00110633pilonHSYRG00145 [Hibiscus syriacus]|uniref:Transposase MuDR plant domain-containing protein n=1 Tax=Hibiscus syriacus TaxID=106335 RepID=A0A6A3A1B8_HIBSY|nr:hypothetical protein F3Y22_tig00110633pilonHSYRG00145 [Hibiscus syriacus]